MRTMADTASFSKTERNAPFQAGTAARQTGDERSAPPRPTGACIRRIQQDLRSLYKDPLEGILVIEDEARVDVCHALISGPADTPYEFGFFYFEMKFPSDYPHNPPRVLFRTTEGGRVRFNPNLYRDGKVCLSILGTWSGPRWSPVQTIGSTLLSIQSLMNSAPFHNEPGFEDRDAFRKQSDHYNQYLRHETIRVAFVGMADDKNNNCLPPKLAEVVRDCFQDLAAFVKCVCDEYSAP